VTVRELCGLFVIIINAKIYLLHQTAKEFLVRNESLTSSIAISPPDSRNFEWKHSLQPRESNRILAEICIWYLTLDFVETRLTVLLDYSAYNWAAHFRKAGIQSEEAIAALAQSLCETGSERYKAWSAIYASYAYV
jgi:ankyrin repeat domain-containing protein 50